MSDATQYNEMRAEFDAVKAKRYAKIRDAILEECATSIEKLGVMRKMWTPAEMATFVRSMKDESA